MVTHVDDIIARTEALLAGITQGDIRLRSELEQHVDACFAMLDMAGITQESEMNSRVYMLGCGTLIDLHLALRRADEVSALVREYMEEVKALRHAVGLTLEWFGPSFEHDDDTECPVCDELTEHMSNCPYPALMRWSKG